MCTWISFVQKNPVGDISRSLESPRFVQEKKRCQLIQIPSSCWGKSRTQTANSRATSLSCCLGRRASQAPTRLAAKGFVSQNAFQAKEKTMCSDLRSAHLGALHQREYRSKCPFFQMRKRTRCFHTGVTLVRQQKSNNSTGAGATLPAKCWLLERCNWIAGLPYKSGRHTFLWRGNTAPLWRNGEL